MILFFVKFRSRLLLIGLTLLSGAIVTQGTANEGTNDVYFDFPRTSDLVGETLGAVLSGDGASGFASADAVGPSASPEITIISPLRNVLVSASSMSISAVVSNKPLGWGIEFVLNSDLSTSVVLDSPPYEHTFKSLNRSEYQVGVHLVNEFGIRQTEFSKYVEFGIGDYYVAYGDSITRGLSDDLPSDNTSIDGRNESRGYGPILNNLLTMKSGYPQTVVNAGISGNSVSTALARLPGVLAEHPEANYVLILLGTNDAYFAKLNSGIGLREGVAGYAGSYKDYMQRIISTVVASGKSPILAKLPIIQPTDHEVNLLIQEYNSVIDELNVSNSLTIEPPDFYSLFENNPSYFSDNLHPNGKGYIEIANYWSKVIAN